MLTLRSAIVVAVLCVASAHTGARVPPLHAQRPTDTWTLILDRPIPGKYEDFSFPTPTHGWVTTAHGEILHTADGGRRWTVQARGHGIVRSVDFLDASRGFAGTLAGKLLATTDGGTTWTDITATLPHPARGFCGITHVGDRVHIVGRYSGGATDYFYSPDAGKTWQHTDLSAHAQGLVDVAFVSKDVGFIGGMAKSAVVNQGGATILKTVDGGRTWKPVYVHETTRGFAWKLWPVSANILYAALQSQDGVYRVAKSTDRGERWQTLIVAKDRRPGIGVQGIGFTDARNGWIGGFFSGMYRTGDGGHTWTFVDTNDAMINRFELVGRALLTGSTRGILRHDAAGRTAR